MPPSNLNSQIASLVVSSVPAARKNERLRIDLIEDAQHILSSHIGSSRTADVGHLSSLIRRHLSPTESLRFSNLLARLLDQDLLTRKQAILQFLHALSGSSSQTLPPIIPSLAPPASVRTTPTSPRPRSPLPDAPPGNRSVPSKTKAEILRDYRSKHGRPHLPEHLLLRDALYLLQGISGKYVKFTEQKTKNGVEKDIAFMEDSRYIISHSTRVLILRLSELGHLYVRVESWVREREGRVGVGMIEQSLCHHLQSQLTEYYRLIAILESQMSRSNASDLTDNKQPSGIREEETGLTLRRLEVWIDEWRLRMRMMSVCVEGCTDAYGGALVSLIHGYTDNGDPFVRNFTDQLLEEVSKPFFGVLQKWLFSGELQDPYSEFFVAINPDLAHLQYMQAISAAGSLSGDGGFTGGGDDDDRGEEAQNGLRLWQGKYLFKKEMLPSFVGESFAKKIFSTGKSLNFIRYSCHDSEWVATRNKLHTPGRTLKYSDLPGLARSIDTAYQIASQRLFDVFFDKFKLLDHLKALKHYLLLGHGDFADQLMDALLPSLSRPANTLYRHNLTATLEAAIRSTNARFDPPDVHRRLDARMLEYSHGEIGWDVFTLEYKVDPPINTVIDPASMEKYLKIFNHLWKIRRVEGAISTTWMRIAGGARSLLKSAGELQGEWHQIRLVLGEMIHFIRQLQAYCQLEAVECSWKELMEFVKKKEGDLDALITAHRVYLDRMVKKVLLISPKVGKEEHLLLQLRELFNSILQFRDAVENLYNYCLAQAARSDSFRDEERGLYTGFDPAVDLPKVTSIDNLPRILRRVKEYSGVFSERAQAIVHALQVHPDLDCRFLAIRLNFSDFYRSRKELKAEAHGGQSGAK